MRIRVFSPLFPFPPDEGNFLTVYDQIQTFAQRHQVEVVSWLNSESEIAERKKRLSPVPFRDDVAWRNLSRAGRTGPESGAVRFLRTLAGSESSTEGFFYPRWPLPQVAALPRVDLELFHHLVAYPWLKFLPKRPGTRRVCMAHDLSAELYEHRSISAPNPFLKSFYRRCAKILARHEHEIGPLTDELWFVSPSEMAEFAQRHSVSHTRLTSPTFNPSIIELRRAAFLATPAPPPNAPPIIGILGGMSHAPNLRSVEFVVDELAPLLEKRQFKGEIHVIGGGAPLPLIDRARAFPFIRMRGFVPDLTPFWNNVSLMLCPHVFGTGVRMKLLESLAFGVPVLANPDAVHRIHPELRQSPLVTVAPSPNDWVDVLVRETAQTRRRAHSHLPVAPALLGSHLYSFLDSLPTAQPTR